MKPPDYAIISLILIFAVGLWPATGIAGYTQSSVSTTVASKADLKSLYDGHEWFKLRDAVQAPNAPALYRGAVAAAFNDFAEAEKILQSIIKFGPNSSSDDARGLLIYVYQRAGQYKLALAQIEKALAAEPNNPGLKNARTFFGGLSQAPQQAVVERRFSRISYSMKGGNMFIPLSINGQRANYIVDTGANVSAMSESEAKRLGLTVIGGAVEMTDATGGQAHLRTAFADRLTVGNVVLRHVAFLIARDDQQPFVDLSPGERGALGLPVLLAFQTLRWKSDGTFEIAFASNPKRGSRPNLCFEGVQPVVEAEFHQRKINLFLDTGAVRTRVLPKFAKEFSSFVNELGKRDSAHVKGIGNEVDIDAITLPELTLRFSAFDATLSPAQVLLKETSADSRWWHAWAGLDLINQAHVVTLDFPNMTVVLE